MEFQNHFLDIPYLKTCDCPENKINCLSAKEWMKNQVAIWEFHYTQEDIRDKAVHPATFPIALAQRVIELFTHEGELVIDPFVGSGTTLVAAQKLNRNAVGFDLQEKYVELCRKRLANENLFNEARQIAIHDDARNIPKYILPNTASLIWTSPPYANMLNRERKNKSFRSNLRKNEQFGKIEQYSQNPDDLGTLSAEHYIEHMGMIFANLHPILKPKGHCVINIQDPWIDNTRIPLHVDLIKEFEKQGYELRNVIIWDRRNIVNNVGIFGWPSNYITLGTTFEYILDFWRPE